MPRLNNGQEVFKELTSLSVFRIQAAGGDTTTTANTAAGVSVVPVTAITSFTNGDPVFLIGENGVELNAINGAPNVSMPVKWKVAFAAATGSRFVEAVETALGHIDEQGITFRGNRQLLSVISAVARSPIAFIPGGPAEMSLSFRLLGYNNLNLQTAFGITEAEIGTGTAADPWQIGFGVASIGSQGTQAFRVIGTRVDGRTVQIDFCDATAEVGVEVQLGNGISAIPVTLRFVNIIQRIW